MDKYGIIILESIDKYNNAYKKRTSKCLNRIDWLKINVKTIIKKNKFKEFIPRDVKSKHKR